MIPSPILKVLSTIQKSQVKCLLMGGQACVSYGAAEFSRDVDIAILLDEENMASFSLLYWKKGLLSVKKTGYIGSHYGLNLNH